MGVISLYFGGLCHSLGEGVLNHFVVIADLPLVIAMLQSQGNHCIIRLLLIASKCEELYINFAFIINSLSCFE